MARKIKERVGAVQIDIMPGTQEFATREFFAREKAAYEKRTGETVWFELDAPLTSTPIAVVVEESTTPSDEASATPPNQGGEPEKSEEEGESQGDDE